MKRLLCAFSAIFIILIISSCNNREELLYVDDISTEKVYNNSTEVFVSKEEGLEVANDFFEKLTNGANSSLKGNKTRSNEISSIETIGKDNKPLMYVINYTDRGFVVVSATKDYYPIIAYSDESNLDISKGIPGLDAWIEEAKTQIEESSEKSDSVKTQIRNLWEKESISSNQTKNDITRSGSLTDADIACYMRCEDLLNQYGYEGDQGWHFVPLSDARQVFEEKGFSGIYQNLCYSAEFNHSLASNSVLGYKICTTKRKVGPLIKTNWHQNSPFNNYCNGSPAGCGAIAVAQVVYYHQYPQLYTYNGISFEINSIPKESNANSPQGLFVRMIADYIGTHFTSGYSYTTPGGIEDGMKMIGYDVSTGDEDEWMRVNNELFSGKNPIIMLGNEDNLSFLPGALQYIGDSHYWICDGADETTFNVLFLFTEWQPYGKGQFVPGWNSIDDPYTFGGSVGYEYFHINWGWGGSSNGWFGDVSNSKNGSYDYNDQNNTNHGHYEHSRKNFYIKVKR